MLDEWEYAYLADGTLRSFREENLRALSSLTGLVHLKLGSIVGRDEVFIAISSLTAISYLFSSNPC
jgi:hypothetical protein